MIKPFFNTLSLTNFEINPCFDSYQEIFFDQFLIDGAEPYQTSNGESYYSLKWTYTPDDPSQSPSVINSISNNVNFSPLPGSYELLIYDSNGCTTLDQNGDESPLEFVFSQSLTSLEVIPAGGLSGDQYSTPVSCEIGSEDGQISIEVLSSDPYVINWDIQQSTSNASEQRLLLQGSFTSATSSEVYSLKINDIPIFYETSQLGEPIANVISGLTNVIDSNSLFTASVDQSNPNEIIILSSSGAAINLEVVSQSTALQMVNTSSNGASWVPLDGSNGNPNYTGFLTLNNFQQLSQHN